MLETIDFVWLGIVFIGSVCLGLVIRKIYHGKKVVQTKEVKKSSQNYLKDDVNKNYVCLTSDPINTVNDLRKGSWNMDKVREGFALGILRYARQSEVDKARELGIIKD